MSYTIKRSKSMEKLPLKVSEALALINQTLEYAFPTLVVEGEVASFKVNQSKYVFFDIKDEESTLGCFMMVYQLRMPLEDGMKVQVIATPKLTPWGRFSLTVRDVRPVGEGSLKRSAEILKTKLTEEGLFAPERKRLLPALPRSIAVIASTQSAGYADFVKILNERWGGVRVTVAHVQVQGTGAADQIVRAIQYFNEQKDVPEVLAIIRGGGSADDLSIFNDEVLVRAIAASRVPTIVGVGHETDESLADLAADVRAATPSHAAQLIVPDKQDVLRTLRSDMQRAAVAVEGALTTVSEQIDEQIMTAYEMIAGHFERLTLEFAKQRAVMSAYDPKAILERGYGIVRGEVLVGSIVEVEQAKRYITAEVTRVRKK